MKKRAKINQLGREGEDRERFRCSDDELSRRQLVKVCACFTLTATSTFGIVAAKGMAARYVHIDVTVVAQAA